MGTIQLIYEWVELHIKSKMQYQIQVLPKGIISLIPQRSKHLIDMYLEFRIQCQ